jgi:hypothetical protein
VYQNALKRFDLNVEANRHAVTSDCYTAREAAENMIEAAAIIANKRIRKHKRARALTLPRLSERSFGWELESTEEV